MKHNFLSRHGTVDGVSLALMCLGARRRTPNATDTHRIDEGLALIRLPSLNRIDVDGYGMYPGTSSRPGLHAVFKTGMTLVLGANGLGKTTLISMIYRMLTGPVDIPSLDVGGELGNRKIETRNLSYGDRRLFAHRVNDAAAGAVCRLSFSLGESQFEVTRQLDTLDATATLVNGVEVENTQAAFEAQILDAAGLSSFGDWVLALRHLVFYFEDRRALVWDATAQRQLLRLLFLPPEESKSWTMQERSVLELDSLVRNLQYSLNKEERIVAKAKKAVGGENELRQQLSILQRIQVDEQEQLEACNDQLIEVTADRQQARVNALSAEQAHESAMRAVERLQLSAVQATFPDATMIARYILGQILAEEHCLTCGSQTPELRQIVEDRIRSKHCPICGSAMTEHEGRRSGAGRGLSAATRLATSTETQLTAARTYRSEAEGTYDALLDELTRLTRSVARRSAEIEGLTRRLPPDEQEMQTHRSELSAVRSRLEQRRQELTVLRDTFKTFVGEVNTEIAAQKDAIKEAFDRYARGFLFEECSLIWSPRKDRVGETGELVEFAAFELDMTGTDFASPVRRTGPMQVSESQREFIDLSFRMALIQVATASGASLVIDAPESSLDAVFVGRAANVLNQFCNVGNENKLVTTSNLIDGDLIPHLLARSGIKSARDPRVIDLLRVAAPTAAVSALHADYASVRAQLFERAKAVSV